MARKPPRLNVVITPQAQRDINRIWDYNCDQYGPDHADSYINFLDKETAKLQTEYQKGKIVATAASCLSSFVNLMSSSVMVAICWTGFNIFHLISVICVAKIADVFRIFHPYPATIMKPLSRDSKSLMRWARHRAIWFQSRPLGLGDHNLFILLALPELSEEERVMLQHSAYDTDWKLPGGALQWDGPYYGWIAVDAEC